MFKVDNVEYNAEIEDVLDRLKKDLAKKGLFFFARIKTTNGSVMTNCPYHNGGQEKKPSFGIRKSDGMGHCFSCNAVHSLPYMIGYCFGENEAYGKKWLQDNFSNTEYEETRKTKLTFGKKEQPKPTVSYIDPEELKKYRFIHPYMYERKLNKDVIRKFDIGYDRDRDCITFPNRDLNGNILFIARRHTKRKYFNYPEKVDKPVYGLYEISRERNHGKKINRIIITESMLDALYLWTLDMPAIALNGLGSSKQMKILNDYDCRSYVLATDNDKAGHEAREKIRKALKHKIVREFDYGSYPEGCKDINDMTPEQIRALKIV